LHTRDQLEATFGPVSDGVFGVITSMQEQIVALTAHVKELEDLLKKDSHNSSSKPPSSDGFKKKPVSLRGKLGKKPGRQHGHTGRTIEFSESPDKSVSRVLTHCTKRKPT